MAITLSSPVTGSAQTGLTSPTYTVVSDTAPTAFGKQYAVTALGGTQTGVTVHSVSSPFTVNVVRPSTFRLVGVPHPVTGRLGNVPRNVSNVITRHGVLPLAGQAVQPMLIRTTIECPAGADLADPANIRAAMSFHLGCLSQLSAALGDSVVSGVY